ncbi:MAG: HemK2/MTQ2 family protein methyltransferase [Nanoarchaeota archaeon]
MIYSPREDSFLLTKEVEKLSKGKKVLDMGTGSGIQAIVAKKTGAREVIAVDIDVNAVNYVKNLGIKTIKSDLFKKIKGKFELIIFNPPYLPEDKVEDLESARITSGGKNGDEIILRFLKECKSHLKSDGIILLLISSLTPKKRIDNLMKKINFKYEILQKQSLFMEKIEVWKIERI